MSAFIVQKAHIDALLSTAMAWDRYGPLVWLIESPGSDSSGYQEGEPWGPGTMQWYETNKRELSRDTAGRVGAMLLAENQRSVNHRYAEDDIEIPYEFKETWALKPIEVLKALDCFEYQSCEHQEWHASEAKTFCEALRRRAIHMMVDYDDAAGWDLDESRVRYVNRYSRGNA